MIILAICTLSANAQVIVPFEPRTSYLTPERAIYNIKGDFTLIGNLNLRLPGAGNNNGNVNMIYVNVDDDPSTVNSSSATLQFSLENNANPECSKIIYAGLYWTGRTHNLSPSPNTFTVFNPAAGSNVTLNKGTVKLKHADATSYTTVQASHANYSHNIYYPTTNHGFMYSAFAEVTDYVKEFGLGEYFVADIALMEGNGGSTGYYGGWGMIVVYENPAMNWRDVTIFDGHAYVANGGNPNELPVSGFRTVQEGPVNLKLGLIAGEGDRSVTGDYFQIKRANNSQWLTLVHPENSTNNFFNSTILTGGNPRNPNLANNLGLDIVMFNVNNPGNTVIANNQTSTTFRYGTTTETYIIFCIAMAVDAFIPDTEAFHRVETIDGEAVIPGEALEVRPGQLIEFSLEVRNKEQEGIQNFEVTIPIPFGTRFESSNAEYFQGITGGNLVFNPSAGPTGSIVWNIPLLPQQANPSTLLAKLTYFLEVSEDCFILSNQSCNLEVIVGGSSRGTGIITGISFANIPLIQGYIEDEENQCQGAPITDPINLLILRNDFINANCQPLEDYLTRNFHFCNPTGTHIPFVGISGNFPSGSRFYNSIDTNEVAPFPTSTEYVSGSSFPIVSGNQSYYAIPPGSTSCYWEFTITVGNLTVSEPTGGLTVCSQRNISITHSTTGVTSIGEIRNLPTGVSATYSNGQVLITGTPSEQGTFNYSIALLGECDGFMAEGTIVIQEPVTAGEIGSDQTVGYNTIPAPITSLSLGGGSGTISYFWESSTTNETTGFTIIVGANSDTYSPGKLTQTTWFRRTTVSSQNGVECSSLTSNTVVVIVIDIVTPGQIAQDQTICIGVQPQPITNVEVGTGGGDITYKWESSTVGQLSGFVEIAGEILQNLSLGALTQTTWVRRTTFSYLNGVKSESFPSNVVQITVQNVEAGSIATSHTICFGGVPSAITSLNPGGGPGEISYLWEGSTTNGNGDFSPIPNQIQQSLQLGALTQTTWVRRTTVSALNAVGCYSDPTNVVEVTVQAPVTAGQIEKDQQICYGDTPDTITSRFDGTGSGIVSYLWQKSTSSASEGFSDIDGATGSDYLAGALRQTTWLRRITISTLGGVFCPSTPTEAIEIDVANEIQTLATVTRPIMCHNSENGAINISAIGGWGSLQYSINGVDYQSEGAFGGLGPNTYSCLVMDQRGCEASSDITLVNPPVLTLEVRQTAIVRCKGEASAAIQLKAGGGWGTYSFSKDANSYQSTPIFDNLVAGTYTFHVSDAQGCVASETIEIKEPEFGLSVQVTDKRDVVCFGQSNGLARVLGLNGWGNYFYLWNTQPAQTTPTASGLTKGLYQVEVRDEHGCITRTEIQIDQPQPVVISNVEVLDVHCKHVEKGGRISFDVAGGAISPLTYLWSNGQTSESLSGIMQGDYTVEVTDFNGCKAGQSFKVLFLDEDCIVRIPQGFSPNGDGVNETWIIKNLSEEHPNNIVRVFNRSGTLVFEATPSTTHWDGKPNRGNVMVGKNGKLPPGVYFYMIWFEPESTPITGSLFIAY